LDSVVCGDNCDVLGRFPRESVDLVVTSPPYDDLRTYGGHSWDFYGVAWQLKRVLKPGGTLVFKWNETDVKLKDVLALAPVAPVFGHTTGRQAKTIWATFFKLPNIPR
jgi:DNA modification methylase